MSTSDTLVLSPSHTDAEIDPNSCNATVVKITPEIQKELDRLDAFFKSENLSQKEIGEILIFLTEENGFTMQALAERFHKDRSTLVSYKNTVKLARENGVEIDPDVPFAIYDNAARSNSFVPMSEGVPILIAGGTVPMEQGELKSFPMFTNRQAAKIALKTHAKRREDQKAIEKAPLLLASARQLINRCHHSSFTDVLSKLPLDKIKLAWIDVPYGQFRKMADGSYPMSDSISRNDSDNNSEEEAVQLACEVWEPLRDRMIGGGVAVLWQAGTGPLRIPIQNAMYNAGWVEPMPVIWWKKKQQQCDPTWPWVTSIEIAYVTWLQGQQPVTCSVNSYRANILDCVPVQHRIENAINLHTYQKPEDLCEVFIERHTRPGELILDMCGCSGSMCIAADRLGRNWVYSESNQKNFDWGARRIADAIQKAR